MKRHLLNALAVIILIIMPTIAFAQPTLGTAKNYVIFSGVGAVSNVGAGTLTLLTGNVGSNGSTVSSNFGNVDGVMHDNDGVGGSGTASTDLLAVRDEIITLGTGTVTAHVAGFGAGELLPAAVYKVDEAASMTGILTLNGSSTDVFVFIIDGSLSIATGSQIILTGGATACNVFWQINGLIEMSSGADLKGTYIAKSGAITMDGVTLEGRVLAVTGAITVSGITARIPIGCQGTNPSPSLTGPDFPVLNATECYVLLTGNENVTCSVPTALFTGNIGTNVGLTTGFTVENVDGTVHSVPDVSTAEAATDLLGVYDYLNGLTADITLLYPVDLGKELVLTPHTYILNSAAALTGKLYLNAQGDADAVFVIKIAGALSTAAGAEVVLQNDAQAKNVFWCIKDGAVGIEILNYFKGTVVANAGAIDIKTGSELEGRALTLTGAITTAATSAHMPPGCLLTDISPLNDINVKDAVLVYPNPFSKSTTIMLNNASQNNCYELRIYNSSGNEVMNTTITNLSTTLETGRLPSGIYFYKITGENKTFKSGKLVVQK